jgi:iron complex transport system substrate-binding protein
VQVIQFDQPDSFIQSCAQFIELGRLLGLEQRAKEIIKGVMHEVEIIIAEVADLPPQKVLLQIGSQPLYTAIGNSFTHDFIELANGINVVGDLPHGRTNYEKIIAANPDVIIIAIMGSESGIAGQEKRKWQQFPILHAVQHNRIHIVDPDLACSPSPATFAETLRIIVGLIHPETELEE